MKQAILSSILLALSVATASAQLNTWVTQNPPNLAGYFRAVQMVTPTTMFAVGDDGIVAKSGDGGATLESHSISKHAFYGVNFIDTLMGMAVGELGTAFKTTDGGNTWNAMSVGGSDQLNGVLMVDHSIALVGGGSAGIGTLRVSRDSGATWQLFPEEFPIGVIKRVRMLRPDFIVLVGTNGTFYVSHDSAKNFDRFVLPHSNDINDACFLNERQIVGVGGPSRYLIGSSDAGGHWTQLDTNNFDLGTATLNGVDSRDAAHVVAVGDQGEIIYSTDSGRTWTRSFFASLGALKDVSMYSGTDGLLVGEDGLLMRTSDGGVTWDFIPRRPEIMTLRVIRMTPDGKYGFASGGYGSVLCTIDSGHVWQPATTGTIAGFYDAVLSSSGRGVCVGDYGTILRTTNAGVSWTNIPSGTSTTLRCIAQAGSNDLYIGGDGGLLLRSSDGGQSWTRGIGPVPDTFGITGLAFFDSLKGLACSPFGTFKTTDAGSSWRQVLGTGAGFLRSLSVAPFSKNVFAVGFSLSLFPTFGYSTDAGETWSFGGTGQACASPYAIFTSDGYHATMVGRYGQIAHTSGPTGPWALQNSYTTNTLFGVGFGSTHAGWSCGFRGTILRIDTDEEADVLNRASLAPARLTIEGVYPNPAVDRIRIQYRLDESGPTSIEVFDLLGAKVHSVELGMRSEGEHAEELSLGNLASGTYLLSLSNGSAAATTRLIVSR